jgi:hypothetical protein
MVTQLGYVSVEISIHNASPLSNKSPGNFFPKKSTSEHIDQSIKTCAEAGFSVVTISLSQQLCVKTVEIPHLEIGSV